MVVTVQDNKLAFDSAPFSFLTHCKEVFPDSAISTAILPLHDLEVLQTTTLHTWLQTNELAQLEKFTLEKRSREWLGGRLTAKRSAKVFFRNMQGQKVIPEYAQCQVLSEVSGRPYFAKNNGLNLEFPELSISHSKKYAAAMSSLTFCGIDIQYSAKTLGRVQEKFCTANEEHILKNLLPLLPPISRLTQLWSAKEAAKKMLSPGGIPGFHELELQQQNKHTNGTSILSFSRPNSTLPIQVVTTMFNSDYALAICCAQPKQKSTDA